MTFKYFFKNKIIFLVINDFHRGKYIFTAHFF